MKNLETDICGVKLKNTLIANSTSCMT